MKSLKIIYNLSYDTSGFDSGLINWYNKLIDKSYEELVSADVCKMIRQGILNDVATQRAVDLFFEDPYDGEHNDGELLGLLVSLNFNQICRSDIIKLTELLRHLKQDYTRFEWLDEESQAKYGEDIDKILQKKELLES